MPLILGANSLAGGYQVKNSARFNSGSSDSLTRTPATTGTSRRIMTFSFWTKRSGFETTNAYRLFSTFYGGGASQFWIRFADSGEGINKISIASYDSSFSLNLITTQVFRDISAWYHFVISFDTTQATSSNRVKMYVNGEQVTSFSTATYPSQNYDLQWNVTQPNQIGGNAVSANEFYNGYFSEIYFIDGQQLTPSSFGETDTDTGIWKPKAYTGTFGTNGFYLDFEDSANLGNDMSGNNNDFTVNNLTSVDQTADTPTNNFATLNFLSKGENATLSEGNLKHGRTATTNVLVFSTIGMSSGKWYAEYKATNSDVMCGLSSDQVGSVGYVGQTSSGYGYYSMDGNKYNSTITSYGATYTTNDIIGIAFDRDNGNLTFYKNGVSQGTAFTGLTSGEYFFAAGNGGPLSEGSFNFGYPEFTIASGNADANGYGNFEYAVPSGYYALCTKNLAQYG